MTEVTYLFVFEIAKIRAKTKKREKTGQQFIKKFVIIMAETKENKSLWTGTSL